MSKKQIAFCALFDKVSSLVERAQLRGYALYSDVPKRGNLKKQRKKTLYTLDDCEKICTFAFRKRYRGKIELRQLSRRPQEPQL